MGLKDRLFTSQKSDLSKPLIACGFPRVSARQKTGNKSDIQPFFCEISNCSIFLIRYKLRSMIYINTFSIRA